MSITLANPLATDEPVRPRAGLGAEWRALLAERQADRIALALSLCTVPISIAVAEAFLAVALLARVVRLSRRQANLCMPRVFWFWVVWAGGEIILWLVSPDRKAGWSEIRHLLLIAAMFFVLPALDRTADRLAVWKGIFLTSSLSALFLIVDFAARLVHYRREVSVTADPSLYLRSGGLLNNWMVFGTVQVMVWAGLISFWHHFPKVRRRWLPVVAVQALATVLSMTRMTWVASFLLLVIHLVWHRSRWLLALPILPVALYLLAPAAVRSRVNASMKPDHYSNLERIQMLRVGWEMLKKHPWAGVGPGQVDRLYLSYLEPRDPRPAWHGHLHNNPAQLAAEFGVVVLAAALFFTLALFHGLARTYGHARSNTNRFLSTTALLALTGFLVAGLFDYTYGHALALILLSFAALTPLFAPFTVSAPASPSSD